MRRLAPGVTAMALQGHAWGHHNLVHFDLIGTDAGDMSGIALLTFLVLAAVGIVRAVARHRKDR